MDSKRNLGRGHGHLLVDPNDEKVLYYYHKNKIEIITFTNTLELETRRIYPRFILNIDPNICIQYLVEGNHLRR